MFESNLTLIAASVLVMATLYSTVGHGGGSGYLAVMAIAGIAPEEMRPTALLLNVVVASITTWRFGLTGTFRKELFIPLICASVPAAFVGGYIEVPTTLYRPVVGIILLYAAIRLFVPIRGAEQTKKPPVCGILMAGVCIGVFSGMIGVGGGIFLSPLVILLGWATAKQTAAISAPFILVNSISGLGGILTVNATLPVNYNLVVPLAIAVVIGGIVGSSFGSRRLGSQGLRQVLGIVLLVASIKMFLTMASDEGTPTPQDTTMRVTVKSTS